MSVVIDSTYLGDLHCESIHLPSGARLLTDAPTDNGGKGEAFSPTDLVATALGDCLLTIMGLLARRMDLDLAGTRARVVKEMAALPLRRIGALTVTVTFPPGLAVSADDRLRFERAADRCPVLQSLHPDVAVELRFEYPEAGVTPGA